MEGTSEFQTSTRTQSSGSSDLLDNVQAQASQVTDKTRELAGNVIDSARSQVQTQISQGKDRLAESLDHVADAVRQSGTQLEQQGHTMVSGYIAATADQTSKAAQFLHDRSVDDIVSSTADFARREPGIFVGSALVLGLIAGRFLRSSAPMAAS